MEDDEERWGIWEGRVNGRAGTTICFERWAGRPGCVPEKETGGAFSPIPAFPLFRVARPVQSPSDLATNTPQSCQARPNTSICSRVCAWASAGGVDDLWMTLCQRRTSFVHDVFTICIIII